MILVEALSNVSAMSKNATDVEQDIVAEQLREVIPTLERSSIVVGLDQNDDIWRFNHNFLLNGINRRYGEFTYPLCQDGNWRRKFATMVHATWKRGGDVWISKQLSNVIPPRESDWIDGENPCVTWSDIPNFFKELDMTKGRNEDSVLLLDRSASNEEYLSDIVLP